jgi:oligosaccharide reducing-end xylanase
MYIHKMDHPAHKYFAWSVKRSGTPNAESPAPDGEEYIVTALYFAAARWPGGKGIYHYKEWADKILSNMRHHPLISGMTSFGLQTTGSMVNKQKKMILFVPHSKGKSFSDPSYLLPAFYEVWARCGPADDRQFWAAADSRRVYFKRAAHPETELCPDYADFDGMPVATAFNPDSLNFAYDSWRTAMNWSVDWAWWHKDPSKPDRSTKVQSFFAGQGMENYGIIYTLDGKVRSRNHKAGLVAANATLSQAAPSSTQANAFVEAQWSKSPLPVLVNFTTAAYCIS